MTNFKQVNISDYPAHILKTYSNSAKQKLAERAIDNQDYKGLEHILKFIEYPTDIIYKAIEKLDVEAIKIITKKVAELDFSYYKDGTYVNPYIAHDLFDQEIIYDIADKDAKRIEILKILLNSKTKESITLQNLQILADHISKIEFEDFVKAKELDLTSDEFKGLELSQYKMDGLEAVVKLDEHNPTTLNFLLSRTFSSELTADQLKTIYTDLYNLDPIAKEMLIYTAALISQNNSLKIGFTNGTSSYYCAPGNIINIGNNFINDKIFNIQSVLIHEIGHFVYHNLFHNEAMPFTFKHIYQYIQEFAQKYINDPYIGSTSGYLFFSENKYIDLKPLILPIMQYEKNARLPVDKAAELLLVNKNEYNHYLFSDEYSEYFKDNSYIDLFFLNSIAGFQADRSYNTTVQDHVFNNILRIYLSEQNSCENYNPYSVEFSRDDIIKWSSEQFLPELITRLNLSNTQIHFLDRIADYINRGHHLLDQSFNSKLKNEKYAELIVRAMELKAAGLGPELTDSFKGIEHFHIVAVSPLICQVIQESNVVSMPFDYDLPGTSYNCLEE